MKLVAPELCLPECATIEDCQFQEAHLVLELMQHASMTAHEVETTGAASSPFRFN